LTITPIDTIKENFVAAMQPWLNDDLESFLEAVAAMFEQVELYANENEEGDEGWVVLFDPDRCPAEALPYLAQIVGERLPKGVAEDDARLWIKDRPNSRRGTVLSIVRRLQQNLTGAHTVAIFEREGDDPDTLGIVTYSAETPDERAARDALREVVPLDVILNYRVLAGQTWSLVKQTPLFTPSTAKSSSDAGAGTEGVSLNTSSGGGGATTPPSVEGFAYIPQIDAWSTLTHTYTPDSQGTNRMAFAGGIINQSSSGFVILSITYGGVPMTYLDEAHLGTVPRAEFWYLKNPPSGPAEVVYTLTGSVSNGVPFVGSLKDVNLTSTFRTTAKYQATPAVGGTVSASPTTVAGTDLVIDVGGLRMTSARPTLTMVSHAGRTGRLNHDTAGPSTPSTADVRGVLSTYVAPSTTTLMDWTSDAAMAACLLTVPIRGVGS
jgi:hypothetical protein